MGRLAPKAQERPYAAIPWRTSLPHVSGIAAETRKNSPTSCEAVPIRKHPITINLTKSPELRQSV